MKERFADRVTVPDVIGLPFHVGRDVAWEAEVSLANPDPDGPPIGALAWPGLSTSHRNVPPPVPSSIAGILWLSRLSRTEMRSPSLG